MASIDCKFFSDTLGMSSSMRVLLPEPAQRQIGRGSSGATPAEGKHPVLFLLHGLSDDETIWTRFTALERYVAPLGLAVVMPNVHRSFYTNMKHGYRYWDFVSDELVHKARSLFPLSHAREKNYVAGLSMGGYGALKLGLTHPERFAAAASLSGSCELTALRERPDELALVFGDLASIAGAGGDLLELARGLAASSRPKPKLYQCCGTEDSLIDSNRRFRSAISSLGFDHVYEEGPGLHDWAYWDAAIQRVLAWLPLA
jgi:S-formylglutathione hydrolase FrmB